MVSVRTHILIPFFLLMSLSLGYAQENRKGINDILETFRHPPESAKPWVFWYWMHAAVSREGITADLEAMKKVGIGGAYLMPIQDTMSKIPFQPTVRQGTDAWWAMVNFAMQEAKRLDLKLAMHVSDGFALAGGPWIKPELSMQKLVWTKEFIKNGYKNKIQLEQPETIAGYYQDVAVFAYPGKNLQVFNDTVGIPKVTSSLGTNPQFLAFESPGNKESFKTDSTAWIQYKFPSPFTCRSIRIHIGGNNFQALRLLVQTSNDGINFQTATRLQPPRHGWQDTEQDYTFSIPKVSAKYFRFVYDKEGTEPGAEDIDAAKWKPSLKIMGIYLSDEPMINQYEAKNGSTWRIAEPTTNAEVPPADAIPLEHIIDLTGKMDKAGNLLWTPPPGNWVIVRMGHTSTGQTNATGGAAKGLECDKFNAAAVKLQFDSWFAKAFEKTDPGLANEVLKIFHVDSWECGSQNWGEDFRQEFIKRRGYDLMPFLLVMAGVPVNDAATSERVLHDVRTTIAELVNDIFYVTLKDLAHAKGCAFSAEAIAPTMVSDGLLHYKNVDLPMGEFWLNSPTHDKPNDMLDAISGAHIYGKQIISSESFTSVRMNWGEHPGNIKTLGDRNFALGINKMVLHVFTHNPWLDKKPGMTLDGVGLYFQRDQTWFNQSKAWIDYLTRCQALLQMGNPVSDIGVFTGEEIPRRAVLPDRLVNTLPGIFGAARVASEKRRLQNTGQPLRQIPDGVNHSANMADPEDWVNALNGYAYDSFNPDALMMMTVKEGRVVLPGGASYKILVVPGRMKMNPANWLTEAAAQKITTLIKGGATILIDPVYKKDFRQYGLEDLFTKSLTAAGSGQLLFTPYEKNDFSALGLQRDLEVMNADFGTIGYTHRENGTDDIYFISNQADVAQDVKLSFRVKDKSLFIVDPNDTTNMGGAHNWQSNGDRTVVTHKLEAHQSLFFIFKEMPVLLDTKVFIQSKAAQKQKFIPLSHNWKLKFDKNYGGPIAPVKFKQLNSWAAHENPSIQYYSGTVVYTKTFHLKRIKNLQEARLVFDSIENIATVKVNGINCGTIWTAPLQANITRALKPGKNVVEITVSNTWHNRLIGDQNLPEEKRVTWTTAPFRLNNKPLLPAGIIGRVSLQLKYR